MHKPIETFSRRMRVESGFNPFAALDELYQQTIGHKLFSCSKLNIQKGGIVTAVRAYTSDEVNYPMSELKEIVPNRWTQIVIEDQETFVANSVDGFADVFLDHALIEALGLGSVVNVPVIVEGALLGTVNILNETGYFDDSRLAVLGEFEAAAQLVFVLESKEAYSTVSDDIGVI